jgi:hypothetical protein
MDKKDLVLQIEELEERIAPTVACGADNSGSSKSHGNEKSHGSHSGKSGSGKSGHSGSGKS